jgi:hypothetical protein
MHVATRPGSKPGARVCGIVSAVIIHDKPNDVVNLGNKVGIRRALKGFQPMRLQPKSASDPTDGYGVKPGFFSHQSGGPMRCIGGLGMECFINHVSHFVVINAAWPTTPGCIRQSSDKSL